MMRCALLFVALLCTGHHAAEAAKATLRVQAKVHSGAHRSHAQRRHHKARADPDEGVSQDSKANMQKVIKTLEDIVASIETSDTEETAAYGKFETWCKTELEEKTKSLEAAQFQNEESANAVKEMKADEDKLKHDLEDTEKSREEAKDMVDQANNMRDEEAAKYDQDMTANSQSIEQVTQAIKIVGNVKSVGGFLQQGVLRRLQINEPGESRYVVGVMKGLQSHLEETRTKMSTEETKRKEMHDSLMGTKTQEINSLTEQKMEFQQQLTAKQVALVEKTRLEKKSAQQINEITPIIKQTEDMCKAKEEEYKNRKADRVAEKKALNEAITEIKTYFAKKAAILLGTDSESSSMDEEESGAASFVQEAQQRRHHRARQHGQRNFQGGYEPEGAFDGAKKVVNDLVAIIEKQQADDKELKTFCVAELAKKEGEQTAVEETLKQIDAQIQMKDAEIETLKNEVDELYKVIEVEKVQLEKAEKNRKEAKAVYDTGSKDRELAIKVLAQAKAIVAEMLGTPMTSLLVQKGGMQGEPPATWGAEGARKDVASKGALGLLDMVAEDIRAEQKAADIEEKEAQETYEKLKIENRENFDHMMQEVTDRVKRKAKNTVEVGTDRETKQQQTDDLSSIKEQLTSLHEKCDTLLNEYEQREKKRRFELDQLHDVFDILSGSSVAARTGLLQQPGMAALLQDAAAGNAASVAGALGVVGAQTGSSDN